MSDPSKAAKPEEWRPPSEFDVIKELNAHAGRLSTLLGLTVAAVTFTLGNSAMRDALADSLTPGLFFVDPIGPRAYLFYALFFLILNLLAATFMVLNALEPAVPNLHSPRSEWLKLLRKKQNATLVTVVALAGSLASLMITSFAVLERTAVLTPFGHMIFLCGLGINAIAWIGLVAYESRHLPNTIGRRFLGFRQRKHPYPPLAGPPDRQATP